MSNRTMKNTMTLWAIAMTALLTQAGCSTSGFGHKAHSVDSGGLHDSRYDRTDRKAFRRTGYAAIGLGLSSLNPDTSELPGTEVNDRVNNGGQITIGADLSRQLSVEAHSADLGSAGISPEGRINYHMHGASALLYAGKNRHRYHRRGLSGFGRLGVGTLESDAVGDNLRLRQVNSTQVLYGIGAEYVTRMGLGLRGEFVAFDKDVNYTQLALTYRLGRKQDRDPVIIADAPIAALPPITAVATAPADRDADGVIDDKDQCPNSAPNASVNEAGCTLFNGVLEGVNFLSGSSELTSNAQSILDGVATTLLAYPDINVHVIAHTDDRGSSASNQSLSEKRAASVVEYLNTRGVDRQRLSAKAFGESQPIATNETAKGRMQNRRVELFGARALNRHN